MANLNLTESSYKEFLAATKAVNSLKERISALSIDCTERDDYVSQLNQQEQLQLRARHRLLSSSIDARRVADNFKKDAFIELSISFAKLHDKYAFDNGIDISADQYDTKDLNYAVSTLRSLFAAHRACSVAADHVDECENVSKQDFYKEAVFSREAANDFAQEIARQHKIIYCLAHLANVCSNESSLAEFAEISQALMYSSTTYMDVNSTERQRAA